MKSSARPRVAPRWLRLGFLLLIPLLLWWAFRALQPQEILTTVSRLSWWQASVFIGTNLALVGLFGTRWWILIRGVHRGISIPRMAGYWLAGFSVDYMTPAPGFGGEPMLVALLHRRQEMPTPLAAATVGLDRLIDSMVNFAVLSICALLMLHWHVLHHHIVTRAIVLPLGLLVILVVTTASFMSDRLPIQWLVGQLPAKIRQSGPLVFLRSSELRASQMLQAGTNRMLLAVLVSLMIWVGIFAEYWLLLLFLGRSLTVPQLVTAVAAHRLAFLLPVPAGLGAFEASQVFAFRALGLNSALGVGAALIVRARDVLFSLFGLAWATWLSGGWPHLRRQLKDGEGRADG